jgi:type VI protein secretion system component VasA
MVAIRATTGRLRGSKMGRARRECSVSLSMFISDSHPIKAFREILAEIATVRDIEATASFPTDDRHHASVEQIDLTAAGHLTFDELELGALSLRLAVRPSGVIAATTAALSLAMPLAKRRILHL